MYAVQLFDWSVVYTLEKGVAVDNTPSDYCVGHRYGGVLVKMFVNAAKMVHVVVATLYDRVDGRDKVEICVKNLWRLVLKKFGYQGNPCERRMCDDACRNWIVLIILTLIER